MDRISKVMAFSEKKSPQEILRNICAIEGEKIVFSTSLSAEDQVITHMIHEFENNIEIFTLDTGRMFPETYTTLQKTIERYQKKIKVYFPNGHDVEKLMSEKGPSSFYDSVENRKECCHIRKVEPLKRALQGKIIWLTGIRADHSPNRQSSNMVEYDAIHDVIKIHPLFHWSQKDVWDYIHEHQIPYNALHNEGFVSIGCQPCTRAIKPEEDYRAGRWWWEEQSKKECGLHVSQ